MKRILSVLIILGILFSTPVFGWQTSYESSVTRLDFKTYISDNTTGAYKTTNVSKTTIVPNSTHVILGYAIMPLSTDSENIAALHDADSLDPYVDESLIDEAETPAATMSAKWFAYPKKIKVQLTIRQGANTRVLIYYAPL